MGKRPLGRMLPYTGPPDIMVRQLPLRHGASLAKARNCSRCQGFLHSNEKNWSSSAIRYLCQIDAQEAPASAPIRPVYDLPATDAIYQRYVGIDGSAYFVGGLGMTTLTFNNIVVVPICSGVGLRLGANVGYLKFTPTATWNPF